MSRILFTMADVEEAWERAEFAEGDPRLRDELKGAIKGLYRSGKTAIKKTGQLTVATSKRGLKFLRRVGGKASGMTGNIAGKAIRAGTMGVSKVAGKGLQLSYRLGEKIGQNPKAAGAVILGGAALGAGAYAMNRRKKSESSRYMGQTATFSRSRRYR